MSFRFRHKGSNALGYGSRGKETTLDCCISKSFFATRVKIKLCQRQSSNFSINRICFVFLFSLPKSLLWYLVRSNLFAAYFKKILIKNLPLITYFKINLLRSTVFLDTVSDLHAPTYNVASEIPLAHYYIFERKI